MEAVEITKEADLEQSARVLLSFGCGCVVITQSSRGCTVFHLQENQESQSGDQHLASTHQPAFYVEVSLAPPSSESDGYYHGIESHRQHRRWGCFCGWIPC
jgi:sugar/nucleoside kinase (ribokinase family)